MDEATLSHKEHWDSAWGKVRLPKTINTNRYTYWRFDELFREKLAGRGYKSFIEIGCAPASWLIYFNKRFGLDVSGIEYSRIGYDTSKKNLGMAGVRGDVVYGDFFKHDFGKKFDVVFSWGFVEHFGDTMLPLKRCYDLLNKGGMLITIVPNLRPNIYTAMTNALNPSVMKIHKVLGTGDLSQAYSGLGLKETDTRYFGTWNLCMADLGKHRTISRAVAVADEGVKTVLKALRVKKESASLSPYIAAFGVK